LLCPAALFVPVAGHVRDRYDRRTIVRICQMTSGLAVAALAIGISAMIFWHAFFNIGMVVGVLPVVGVTLPLFSYGGSSVTTILIGIGLLMNVSMRRYSFG